MLNRRWPRRSSAFCVTSGTTTCTGKIDGRNPIAQEFMPARERRPGDPPTDRRPIRAARRRPNFSPDGLLSRSPSELRRGGDAPRNDQGKNSSPGSDVGHRLLHGDDPYVGDSGTIIPAPDGEHPGRRGRARPTTSPPSCHDLDKDWKQPERDALSR